MVVPKNAKCPVCGMYVDKHPNWAAVIEDENLYFDGVKDMMKYILKEKKAFEKVFVSDYYKLKKIDAKAAFYVIGSDVYGPMGNELIPFETKNEAITFAKDHNGKMIVTFKEIDEKLLEEL
ncbi:nitrous oxide reductase accessory protein NosL [Campylobacter hyointestinalis]|uniref:nitrous oxide reductase accessory protein NosL n=1 Tax=Campylobacter hyointestinalis TaxID=198 RepID=UPI0021586940|nr:nitrous oxide reductase accessory protein NosL [Campylobacter hyointestinalis]